jgi:hypothetical protein
MVDPYLTQSSGPTQGLTQQVASAGPVLMCSAPQQTNDMHPQQYQLQIGSQQMQSAQHMHSTHQQLLEVTNMLHKYTMHVQHP